MLAAVLKAIKSVAAVQPDYGVLQIKAVDRGGLNKYHDDMSVMCMPPLVGENPVILVLGSMPGAESLRKQQYFAFQHNRFWKILFAYFDVPFSSDYAVRTALAKSNGIALWDTIASCERENSSLDSKIKNEQAVDLEEFLKQYPTIRTIVLNGKKAQRVYQKHFSGITLEVICLPSTSPANASHGFDKLYATWTQALDDCLKI